MNALVPQGKAKKNLDRTSPEPEPVPSGRRRVLGFVLVLLSVFILLPELNFLSDHSNESNRKARTAYLKALPEQEAWPETPEMQDVPVTIHPTRVPAAELASFESQWVKYYSKTADEPSEHTSDQALGEPDIEQQHQQGVASATSNQSQIIKPQQPTPKSAYIVQVATMSSAPNANALMDQLQGLGYRSFIREAGPYHQVMIGPQLRKSDAELALVSVRNKLALKGIIKSYRP